MKNIKVGDVVSIKPNAVVCVGKYYDWVCVGQGAKGRVMEIEYNEIDKVMEARVRMCGSKRSYWFHLDDLLRESENKP